MEPIGFLTSLEKGSQTSIIAQAPDPITPVKAMSIGRLRRALLCLQPPTKQHRTGRQEPINREIPGEIRLQVMFCST